MSQSPVKIVLRLQQSPNEDLDVALAFAKEPEVVREAFFDAICQIQLRSIDITLLRMESIFRSTLKKPWKESKDLQPVLEACRQGKIKSRTESLFFEHGKEYGVIALCAATAPDGHTLMREIDLLQDEELVRLIKLVGKIPKRASIIEFIEEFVQTPEGKISDPHPQLKRPRTRKKGNVLPSEDSPSPSPLVTDHAASEVHQSNKKRRLSHQQGPDDDNSREIIKSYLRLPPPRIAGLSALHYTPDKRTSLPVSRALPVQQSYSRLSYSFPNQIPDPSQASPSQSQYTTQPTNFRAGGELQHTWYTRRRDDAFSSPAFQVLEQGEKWNIPGRESIQGQPLVFDGQASQISGQEQE